MGSLHKNPHNALFLDTFSDLEQASPLLSAILPPPVRELLDLNNLTLTTDHLVDEKL